MGVVEESVEVAVPAEAAYDQWSRFEELPRFMGAVDEIEHLDDGRLRWVVEIGDQRHEWEAVVTEQVPNERIEWREAEGRASGTVTFSPVGDDASRVSVRIDWEPEGAVAKLADLFSGVVERRTRTELDNFKEFVEREHDGSD